MSTFNFALPWPPTNNHMYVNARGGHGRYLSEAGRAYVDRVGELALQGIVPRFKLSGRLGIAVVAHPPNNGRHDLDNLWKGTLDSLKKCGCIPDDSDFDVERICRGAVVPGGRLNVLLWQLAGAADNG
jgi:crossover junction endodeoxyribonuclease RusA